MNRITVERSGGCSLCHDSGFVCAISKKTRNHYAFRCMNCSTADYRKISMNVPEWNKYRREQFFLWGETESYPQQS